MTRGKLALLAFALHYPGLRLFAAARLDRATARWNIVAVIATLLAMSLAAALAARPLAASFEAWLIGHFAWSVCLSIRVACGKLPQ